LEGSSCQLICVSGWRELICLCLSPKHPDNPTCSYSRSHQHYRSREELASGKLPRTPGHKAWRACPNTPSNQPPPFVRGLLSHKNRHLFTSGLQILSQHAFFADYSDQFRPLAGDNTFCPCNDVPFTPTLSPLHSGPPTPLPIHRYSINHVLFDCRLHSDHRASTIGGFSSQYLFSTEAGGRRLAQFLLLSQQGLRPLPPRPDPP
jgi:hypothetical protein